MLNTQIDGLKRIIDLEKLRARRRTLKRLLLGSGVITAGGVIHAQQSNAVNVLPAVNSLLLEEFEESCDEPTNPAEPTPTDVSGQSPESFLLNSTSYTGTASREILVNRGDSDCGFIVKVTTSVCFENVSGDDDEASADIDLIIIAEGLSALNANNDDPAVDYYFRRGFGPRVPDPTPGDDNVGLLETPILRGQEGSHTAYRAGPNGGNSCGFSPARLPFKLKVVDNRPVMTLSETTLGPFESNGFGYTLPSITITLSAGDCNHPTRFESSCADISQDPDTDVGIIILTTPDPGNTGGPIG